MGIWLDESPWQLKGKLQWTNSKFVSNDGKCHAADKFINGHRLTVAATLECGGTAPGDRPC